MEDEKTLSSLSLFEEQVEEPTYNPPGLGGPHVCARLLHLKHIPLPNSDIILENLKGLLWRGRIDEF